jgi:N-carbamoylputrescine amidase
MPDHEKSNFLCNFAAQFYATAMSKVKVGLVQMSCVAEKQPNLDKAIREIRNAAKQGAQIVCLQELFTSLYFCDVEDYDNFKLAEAIPGPSTNALTEVARELNVVIIASLFEKRAEGLYHNTTAVIDADGTYLGKYRKMHIPDDPAFYEKFYFTPGDLGYKTFQTKYAKIGVLICWDQWYPEASRITALMGAEIMFYPTAIGWATSQDEATNKEQYDAWQIIQRSHAVANGVHVVSVNRVGFEQEGAMKFWGGSFVANPQGTLMYLGSHDEEETTVVELDTKATDHYRTHWPFLRDRRIDSYQPITKRYIDEE